MYTTIQFIHSYWAYLVVFVVLIATINALAGYMGNKEYSPKDFRLALFALITTHIQFLIGLGIIFCVSFRITEYHERWYGRSDGKLVSTDCMR